ncbi:aldo/keto reductase [Rhizobium puerariae]|uniref:Aldo/keto reductase n=1 Tax=Rhizobium puerariae TaxID=1585791 RepID=A0ABV6AJC2_9HYPH
MKYARLGRSGLVVSRFTLGCMSFGDPAKGAHAWTVSIDEARKVVHAALDAGVTVFDTANLYSDGSSEEIIGTLLQEAGVRDEIVLATKVWARMAPGPKGGGLSRAAILRQVDESLRRLRTDYIDLYQIHRFDPDVPVEETMEALHDLIRAGKVRYIGASSMFAWQFAKLQHAADLNGLTPFVSMQDQYNLLMREEEREMHPYCADRGVGIMAWSPLARGRLAIAWGETTGRIETDVYGATLYTQDQNSNRAIIDAVGRIASERGVSRAQIALAWVLGKSPVNTAILGPTQVDQLSDCLAAVDLELTAEEVASIEQPYTARDIPVF